MSTANPCSLSRITSSVVLGILMTGSTARPAEHKPTISEIVEGLRRSAWLLLEEPESFKIVCAREETEALGPKGRRWTQQYICTRRPPGSECIPNSNTCFVHLSCRALHTDGCLRSNRFQSDL